MAFIRCSSQSLVFLQSLPCDIHEHPRLEGLFAFSLFLLSLRRFFGDIVAAARCESPLNFFRPSFSPSKPIISPVSASRSNRALVISFVDGSFFIYLSQHFLGLPCAKGQPCGEGLGRVYANGNSSSSSSRSISCVS